MTRANSGVFIRCPAEGPITQGNAFEVNIYDPHDSWPTGSINEGCEDPDDAEHDGEVEHV